MSRSSVFIVIGAIVLLVPFIGVPDSWVALIEALCGIALIGLGLHMRAALMPRAAQTPSVDAPTHPSAL